MTAGALATWAFVEWRVDLPPLGPNVEQICAETMQQRAPDLSWASPWRDVETLEVNPEHMRVTSTARAYHT